MGACRIITSNSIGRNHAKSCSLTGDAGGRSYATRRCRRQHLQGNRAPRPTEDARRHNISQYITILRTPADPACTAGIAAFEELLCDAADDELFGKSVRPSNDILHDMLPPPSTASQYYELSHRTHLLQLPEHFIHLSDCNFFTRMLYKYTY